MTGRDPNEATWLARVDVPGFNRRFSSRARFETKLQALELIGTPTLPDALRAFESMAFSSMTPTDFGAIVPRCLPLR
ncbi:MAG: hypothetical protein OES24_01890 [Acidimicrobiia bacterium]|nr:hypothetical protein [Acidimicrobiia bacterium]